MVGSYYRKPKPETQLKNREEYKNLYSTEIKWLKDNLTLLKDDKFMIDMYTILITGSRKMTPKMIEAVRKNGLIKLSHEDGLKCNSLWRKYGG